jgi:hypothetical protein
MSSDRSSGGFKQVTKAQARGHLSRDERISRLEGVIVPLERREEYVEEISRLWRDAQTTFLQIGRYLVQAADKLEHGEYQAMVENELPFGYQVSYQLRKVAEAIDGGRLPGAELPPSYATIYQLTTLSDAQLQLAQAQVPPLIRPTVKREEIVRFKRELARAAPRRDGSDSLRRGQLERRRKTLEAQRDKILAELAEIERELG